VSAPQLVPADLVSEPCLDAGEAVTLGRLLRKCETLAGSPGRDRMGAWTRAASSFCSRGRCTCEPRMCRTRSGCNIRPERHPAGIGWGSGRAVVVNCECELSRVAPGDVLVTKVAGRRSVQSCRASRRVAELGGSTSHLASLARERGIPMVLGVLDATRRFRTARSVAVDGVVRHRAVAAVMRPAARLRHPADRRERAQASARASASVKIFPDDSESSP
jgi:phosphohistidine swiveling domain-containing protein